jgi:hypothetical protein
MGKIQIKVLAVLQHEPAPLDAIEIAALVYGINPVSAAAYSAVRRALGKPSGKGLVRGGSRHPPRSSPPVVGEQPRGYPGCHSE